MRPCAPRSVDIHRLRLVALRRRSGQADIRRAGGGGRRRQRHVVRHGLRPLENGPTGVGKRRQLLYLRLQAGAVKHGVLVLGQGSLLGQHPLEPLERLVARHHQLCSLCVVLHLGLWSRLLCPLLVRLHRILQRRHELRARAVLSEARLYGAADDLQLGQLVDEDLLRVVHVVPEPVLSLRQLVGKDGAVRSLDVGAILGALIDAAAHGQDVRLQVIFPRVGLYNLTLLRDHLFLQRLPLSKLRRGKARATRRVDNKLGAPVPLLLVLLANVLHGILGLLLQQLRALDGEGAMQRQGGAHLDLLLRVLRRQLNLVGAELPGHALEQGLVVLVCVRSLDLEGVLAEEGHDLL
mmetsp:Transcript_76381/g.196709  ORF Transcript_76381/g.196709 Transcript_76381/m.196709 type:complete len:351 (+) Transcript_76381:29-1081(+)